MRRPALLLALSLTLPSHAGANLLTNAGFDTDLSGWTASLTTASWNALDVAASGASGSALLEGVGGLAQCVAVSGASYTGGAWTYIPSAQPSGALGAADMAVLFFAQAGCAGQPFNTFLGINLQPDPDVWTFLPIAGEVPAGAASALFQVQLVNVNGQFATHFDDATFETLPEPRGLVLPGAAAVLWWRRGRSRRR